jgi:putative Mg2+ transporter-C (MgtC) family protein
MEIEIILKVLLAALLGGIIGLERELVQKAPGMQTNILTAVAAALVTTLSIEITAVSKTGDPTRLTAYIIVAAGLLGLGVIIRERSASRGLSSAAAVLVVTVLGIAVGSGYYLASFLVTIFTVLLFVGLKYITAVLENQSQFYSYAISTEDSAAVLIEVKKIIRELGLNYIDARLRKTDEGYEIEISLNTSKNKNQIFVERVMQLTGVKEITSEFL